jgi:predicted phage tail protein
VIKVKFQSLEKSESDLKFDIVEGEFLSEAFTRCLDDVDTGEFEDSEVFRAVLNGNEIEADLLETIKLKKDDNVLICPIIKQGDAGAIFKQIALIVVATIVNIYAPGLGGPFVQAMAVAGATIAAGLILNALIPPPSAPTDSAISSGEESQMYAVSGQSNRVKKLATVPKVYGHHRVFPTVGANPYTQLENDSEGELVQYLYAIYDFGLGPGIVNNLRIGDTRIEEFVDVTYRYVDLNKPEVNEGPWDEILDTDFQLYKNDVESENISLALNGDSSVSGTPVDQYLAIRNTAANTNGDKQEILINIVAPEGLIGFDSQGGKIERSIDVKLQFRKVGTTPWRAYNDPVYVSKHSGIGGQDSVYGATDVSAFPLPSLDFPAPYTLIAESIPLQYWDNEGELYLVEESVWLKFSNGLYGIAAGENTLFLKDDPKLIVGNYIFLFGEFVGVIVSRSNDPGEYQSFVLDRPLKKSAIFFTGNSWNGFTLNGDPQPAIAPSIVDRSKGYIKAGPNSTGLVRITDTSSRPVYSTFSFSPYDTGQFEVRVERFQTLGAYGPDKFDKLTWATLVTRLETIPIVTNKRHVFLEVRIKATNQLNGSIANLSGTFTSALEVYDDNTQTWSRQLNNNPAWVFTDLLIGEVNKKAITKDRLDLPAIVEWADYCDEAPTPPTNITLQFPRYESNFVLDYRTTLQEVLNQVANSAQATLNMVDGKYSALLDIDRISPVQLFTPRNSKDFSVTRSYSAKPHALKVRFIDPSKNWELSDKVVYDDGHNDLTATEFDTIQTFACTNQEQAWRFGRFMMAQNRYRQEVMSLTVDFEHLICSRGDFVQISQDTMRVGGRPARVKNVVGNTITIDDSIDYPVGPTFGYVFRDSNTGDINQGTLTPLTPSSFTAGGVPLPAIGDLIVVGETDSVVFDCIVKSITPNDDLSARLVLIERAPEVYLYESDDNFEPYNPKISLITDPDSFPPALVEDLVISSTGWDCSGAGYEYFAQLDWGYPIGSVFEYFEIYCDYGLGYLVVDRTSETTYRYVVPDEEFLGNTFNFKVLAVSATGKKKPLGEVSVVSTIIVSKTTAPSDVVIFGTDITNEVLQLSWDRVSDCDASEYLIRFSPNVNATWSSTIPLMRVDSNTSTVSTQARSGVYLIKVIDFNGNESENAARAITTIPELFNLNIVSTITDAPTFAGAKDTVEILGGALVLKESVSGGIGVVEYYPEGYYYYDALLDLGEIYTVRLQSLIEAEGYNIGDLMVNWTTLAVVPTLSTVGVSDWEVQTQYRSTDTFNTISLWPSLDVIDALSEGFEDLWTDWRPFNMGDATGRIFQFRIRLVSNKVSVSPRIFEATIKADMPDRVDNYNNLVSDASLGYTVSYSPAFKGPGSSPNIQVSVENAQSGDYWTFTSRTLDGFTIKFFDSGDAGVSRTFDTMIKGYGRKNNVVI